MADSNEPREIAEARATLDATIGEAKKHFTTLLKGSQERLVYAKQQGAHWANERDKLKVFKDDTSKPENNTYVSIDLLYQFYLAWEKSLEIEIASYQHNLGVVSGNAIAGASTMKIPDEIIEYREQKCRMDLSITRYLVRYNIEGIDAILRATGLGHTIDPVDEADKQHRLGRAAEIKAAMTAGKPVQILVEQLGNDLKGVRDLNQWGKDAFKRLGALDGAGKAALFHDPNWRKLGDKIPLLQELHERTHTVPAINQFFVKWKHEKMPFAPIAITPIAAPPVAKKGADATTVKPTTGSRSSTLKLS